MKLKKSPKELKDELKAKRQEKIIKKQEEKKMKKRKLKKVWFLSYVLYPQSPAQKREIFLCVQVKGEIRKVGMTIQNNYCLQTLKLQWLFSSF